MVRRLFWLGTLVLLILGVQPLELFRLRSLEVEPLYAAEPDFYTDYFVTYNVNEQGVVEVEQKVTLTNNVSDRFVSQYSLSLGAIEVTNLNAEDDLGKVPTTLDKSEKATKITVKFNQQVVGKGKQISWRLNYKTKDLAQKTGLVWEVNLPKVTPQPEIRTYDLTLIVPTSLGEEVYFSPLPESRKTEGGKYSFFYHQEQLEVGGVSAAFGSSQVMNFTLQYHLRNPKKSLVVTEIAFPPDIVHRQKLVYQKVSPPPQKIRLDDDGNYLAQYQIAPEKELTVTLVGLAKIVNPMEAGVGQATVAEIPPELREIYTRPLKFWEADQPKIVQKAIELVEGKRSVYDQARAIYDFVTKTLNYSQERVRQDDFNRRGALKALESPENSVCLEYADLVIALLRAAGIPAREVNGYAYTRNPQLRPTIEETSDGEALHAWAEYYEPGAGWLPIDPTWGSTSGLDYFSQLDTNHLVFVRKGISSELPYPAGAYKTEDNQKGDVQVTFGTTQDLSLLEEAQPKLKLAFSDRQPAWFNQATEMGFKVRNESLVTAYEAKTQLEANDLFLPYGKEYLVTVIPPFGESEFKFTIVSPSFRTPLKEGEIKATLSWQNFEGKQQRLGEATTVRVNQFSLLAVVILLILVVGPALYMIGRRPPHQSASQRPLASRLGRRLRGPGQSPNRHS